MIFIETPVFTSDLKEHLDDEEYRAFQAYLAERPEAGSLIEEPAASEKSAGRPRARARVGV